MGEPAGFLSTTAFCKGTPAIRLGMLDALPRPASLVFAGGELEVSLLLVPCTGFSFALPSAASPKIARVRARTPGCVSSPVFKIFPFLDKPFLHFMDTVCNHFGIALLQPFAGSKKYFFHLILFQISF